MIITKKTREVEMQEIIFRMNATSRNFLLAEEFQNTYLSLELSGSPIAACYIYYYVRRAEHIGGMGNGAPRVSRFFLATAVITALHYAARLLSV